jgi:hypothetical protein
MHSVTFSKIADSFPFYQPDTFESPEKFLSHLFLKKIGSRFCEAFTTLTVPTYQGHGIWISSNETSQEKTMEFLKAQPICGNVFIGTSCLFTLNAFLARPPEVTHLLIVDINSSVKMFWSTIQKIAKKTATKEEALVSFTQYKPLNWPAHISTSTNPGGWLSSDDLFARVKSLFDNGKFAFAHTNLDSPDSLTQIHKTLADKKLRVDTIYQSNIAEFCIDETTGMQRGEIWLTGLIKTYLQPALPYISIYSHGGRAGAPQQKVKIES